jgi:glutamine amidotransferase
MIVILNYGLGNIQAFSNILNKLDVSHRIARSAAELDGADKLILPGVGAFDHAMESFEASGMLGVVNDLVLKQRVPILGICVGMQMMAGSSEEGQLKGLSWIDGVVRKFDLSRMAAGSVLPHMGWNDLAPTRSDPLFTGLERDARFYFLHSYYFDPSHTEDILANSDYGAPFCCSIRRGNIYGVQFHPEKSHRFGVRLLKNFSEL